MYSMRNREKKMYDGDVTMIVLHALQATETWLKDLWYFRCIFPLTFSVFAVVRLFHGLIYYNSYCITVRFSIDFILQSHSYKNSKPTAPNGLCLHFYFD